jgi:tRNA1Val (adenine37-N6)-methyltransferase
MPRQSKTFRFKQFAIEQDQCAMKIGTDGVLLGAWFAVEGAQRVLDIGTGTGLIALMAAQRNASAHLVAVELDASAARQAAANAASSPFADRIIVSQCAIQDYTSDHLFDVIVSNPPFYSAHVKSPDAQRALARHEDQLSVSDLFQAASRFMSLTGTFSLIWPIDRQAEVKSVAHQFGLYSVRTWQVHPNHEKPAHRLLLSYSKQPMSCENGTLTLEGAKRGQYTSAYRHLVSDFYLGM